MPVRNRAPAARPPDPLAPSSGAWAATLAATAIALLAALAVPAWHGPAASRFLFVFPRSQDPAALCELSSAGPRCYSITTRPGGPLW
jgi:hypothetical protein